MNRVRAVVAAALLLAFVTCSQFAEASTANSQAWPQISLGPNSFACGASIDSTAYCWGLDAYDQTKVPADLGAVRDIKAGGTFGCAITQTNEVRCWGNSSFVAYGSQLTSYFQDAAVMRPQRLVLGQMIPCAIDMSSVLICGGPNRMPRGSAPVRDAAIGDLDVCTVSLEGNVQCSAIWGGADAIDDVPASLAPAKRVWVNHWMACAQTIDNQMVCWGNQIWTPPRDMGSYSEATVTDEDACFYVTDGSAICYHRVGAPETFDNVHQIQISNGSTCWINRWHRVQCSTWNQWGLANVPEGMRRSYFPQTPTDLSTEIVGDEMHVNWHLAEGEPDAPVSNFKVLTEDSGPSCIGVLAESGNMGCILRGLKVGREHTVTVVGTSEVGQGEAVAVKAWFGQASSAPTAVAATPSADSVTISWQPPATVGDDPGGISQYRIWHRTYEPAPGTLDCQVSSESRSCTVTGLRTGQPYTFRVVAISKIGASPPVEIQSTPWATPAAPSSLRVAAVNGPDVVLTWAAPFASGTHLTGYLVDISRDEQATWTSLSAPLTASSGFTVKLGPAVAAWLRVRAVSEEATTGPSSTVAVISSGARPMRVTVVDSDGFPVIGGSITWKMKDGSAWSSRTYGLTDDGVIDFPLAPAGDAILTLVNAQMQDGVDVSGNLDIRLGGSNTVTKLPVAPVGVRTVRVGLGNGLPVAYARVSVSDSSASTLKVEGVTFHVETSAPQQISDSSGLVSVRGYFASTPTVEVVYDDGILTQRKVATLQISQTNVTLDFMPWVQVAQPTVTADLNAAVPVTVSVAAPTNSSVARGLMPRSRQSGVSVTVVPPKGAPKGSCKAQMTGKTNSQGKVTLKVCATKSGVYGFKTSGAASVSTFKLFVKGTAPMPVTSVTARSLQVGSVRATWGAPLFDGKSPVVSYTVTASAKGKKTVIKTVKANVKNVTLDGLANATTYRVMITATTKKGTSDPVSVSVPVA